MTREEAIKHLKLMQSGARNAIRFTKNDKEKSEEERKEDIEIYQDKLEALKIATNALEQTRWIPVRERLPEDGYWAIFTNGKQISIERYKHDALDHFYPHGRLFNLEDAVAWMPLPERYKAEMESEE